jgi:two-component system LytT family response regulator
MRSEPVTTHPLIFSLRERNPDHKQTAPLSIAPSTPIHKEPFVSICQKGKMEMILVKDIVFVKAESNYIRIYTQQGHCIMLAKTLKQVSIKLEHLGFVRVHQSFLVHPQQIQCYHIHDGILFLHNGKEIPVSRSYRKFVSETLSGWAL